MSEPVDKSVFIEEPPRVKRGPSLFGPIVLIALGVLLLLYNLGTIPTLDWGAALRLWPLLLVFIGLNIIVQQLPRPWGGLLSALVALLAVGTFGYVLVFGQSSDFVTRWTGGPTEVQVSAVAFPADGIDTAEIKIDFGAPAATVSGLVDSAEVLSGTVSYLESLDFDARNRNGRAAVALATRDGGRSPGDLNWGTTYAWELGINPRIPTDLSLDVGSGAVVLNLQELALTDLNLDGGSGRLEAALPAGDYDVDYNAASGASRLTLPPTGRQEIQIEAASGSLSLALPAGVAARVEIDAGSGRVDVASARLTAVDNDGDGGVWQTADYDPAASSVLLLKIDGGSGSITIEDVAGR